MFSGRLVMKKRVSQLVIIGFFIFGASLAYGQMQVVKLSEYSLQNNKTFIVDDKMTHKKPIRVKVKAVNKGEPAMSPMEITSFIQCYDGDEKPIDLAGYLLKAYGDKVSHFIGRKTKQFPYGVVKVCVLENVNFDETKIFISVLGGGSERCNQNELIDFMIPIDDFCRR